MAPKYRYLRFAIFLFMMASVVFAASSSAEELVILFSSNTNGSVEPSG